MTFRSFEDGGHARRGATLACVTHELEHGRIARRAALRCAPGAGGQDGVARPTAAAGAPFVVPPHESLRAAAQRMLDQDVGCLVVATCGRPHGLLLDWSLVVAVLCLRLDGAEPVDAVPWHPFVSAREGGRVSQAAWLMESHAIPNLPLADEAGRLVGVLSIEDAFARVLDELTALATATREGAPVAGGRRSLLLRARDVQSSAATVDAAEPARAVAERLSAATSDALLVADGTRPIGLVTARALLARFVADGACPASVRAGDLVEGPFACAAPDDPLDDVLSEMARSGVQQIGVGPDRGSYGIVTLRDLISRLVLELAARLPFLPAWPEGGGPPPARS